MTHHKVASAGRDPNGLVAGRLGSRDVTGEGRANGRSRYVIVRRNKKGNGTVKSANPDFGGVSVKVQGALFVYFGGRIVR